MKKLPAASADLAAENRARLAALFPEAVAEGEVDLTVLAELLGAEPAAEEQPRFGLDWPGKARARRHALTPSAATLRPVPSESLQWAESRNLFLEGDNLEVLKLLQRSLAGRVKLVFIDPPYNTGKDFVYPDDYADTVQSYLRITGQLDEGGGRVSSNVEASGRFHTDWLNMIYPRLLLARQLLREDGLLVVTISDAEVHHLRCVLDELLGESNFIGDVIWNSTKSVTNTALISVSHTHCLVYARSGQYFKDNRGHFRLPDSAEGFSNPDGDPRGPWKADPFQVGGVRPNQLYPITNPNTGTVYRPNPGCSWKNDKQRFDELWADDRIVFGATGEAGPQRKRFLSEALERGRVAKTLWTDVDTTTNATKALKKLMDGESVFDNPKPVELVRRFLQLGVHAPVGETPEEDPVVVDFFAGSGTTGQAVMEQNQETGGRIRTVLVQLPEPIDPDNKEQKQAARFLRRLGRPLAISELTKERLRRAGKALQEQVAEAGGTLTADTGFKVYRLDSSNLLAWDPAPEDLEAQLLAHVDRVKEGRDAADLLAEAQLKLGLDLGARVTEARAGGHVVEVVGRGRLLACLSEEITRDQVPELARGLLAIQAGTEVARAECTVLFRDSAFASDVVRQDLVASLRQAGLDRVRSL